MQSGLTSSLVSLGLTVLIVFRFAQREMRERTVRLRTLWIRPAIMLALTAGLIYESNRLDPGGDGGMLAALAAGIVLGLATGLGIVLNTRMVPAGVAGAVRVQGNRLTLGIWLAALAVRVLARFVLPHGADPRAQLPLNAGLVMLTAVAFTVIGVAFARAATARS